MSEEARRVVLVDLIHLVCLVHLVGLVQPNKRDKPNNSLLTLADFFNSLLGWIPFAWEIVAVQWGASICGVGIFICYAIAYCITDGLITR